MIVDSFIFFNEMDILEGRLEYLYDHVDYFVIVESNMTHSGEDKPLYFMKNMSRYKKYLDKVLYYPFITSRDQYNYNRVPLHDRDFEAGTWQAENAQRNHINQALRLFDSSDIIMVSDLDEIPHKDCISIAKSHFAHYPALAIQQEYYCYNFKQRMEVPWYGTVITTNSYARAVGAQGLRNIKHSLPVISHGGWHLTYWGSVQDIQNKIKGFAHQELNTDQNLNPDYIKQRIELGQDLYSRNLEYVKVDPSQIPQDILKIFGNLNNKLINQK